MRVSVVICTLNRAQSLVNTLECLRLQNHPEFEVVVVNGPSTDDTDKVLEPWLDRIRYDRCPVPNLSVSRNIGIRAAAGDIVAFIDDDALPEFDWLNQALPAFDDDSVAGVGGIVFDPSGVLLQYRYSVANRFGESNLHIDVPRHDQCFPGSFEFPYLQGTNALFRRDALLEVGGFDEVYEYYLDETDVCVRLIDRGYMLKQLPDAPVHHKFLASNIRDHRRVTTNWRPMVKNQVYFSYRHALGAFTEREIHERSRAFMQGHVDDARLHEEAGRLPRGSGSRAEVCCADAFSVGAKLGTQRHDLRLGPVAWGRPAFKRFPTVDTSKRRKITFVTSGYEPNVTGGIARFFSDLAPALSRRGHEVRVITKATDQASVDLEEGVWVHRIETPAAGAAGVAPDVLPHINNFATAAVGEIERIGGWSSHDVVYGPLWDVEILGVLHRTFLPVAIQVATPLAIAADLAGHTVDAKQAVEVQRIMACERIVLDEADLFHANSSAVAQTISNDYPAVLRGDRWSVVHLGLVDHGVDSPPKSGRDLTVLFVGRFEARKGIDTFLEAVSQVAPEFPEVHFVVAGEDRPLVPGLPLFGERWRAAVASEPWASRVQFVGQISDEELHRWYTACDIVVLPSRYESFGLVMVEAMMHGKALISCDTSGIRDVVRNGTDGVLVAPGDSAAVADAMRMLLNDPSRRAALGASGRRRFLDSFHIDRFAERFDDFIARVDLHDVGVAVTAAGTVIDAQRNSVGRLQTTLRAGDHIDFPELAASVNRLVLRALEPSTVAVGDSEPIDVPVGIVHRIEVPGGDRQVRVRVLAGTVIVGGVVSVAEPTAR